MVNLTLSMISFFALSLVMGASISFPSGYTCEDDVNGIRGLYAALGYPMLPGWTPFGGDPCLQGWQGVQCVGPNITAIIINDANLGGELGDELGNFTSIITFDLSNNRIGGSIPKNLPLTLRQFFLSSNRLSGKIPSSLAELTLLSDMSLNENFLSGELPDAFQFLSGLVNLDVSSNNLSGGLPPSITSLSSLTTFHVQDNHLSGTLEVLQDLPLMNLNIENNLFSGPVPVKLWNIPNFRSNGNPFNTTIAPSSSPIQAMSSLFAPAPSPTSDPSTLHGGTTSSTRREKSTMRVTVYAGVVVTIVIAVFLVVCALKFREKLFNFICSSKSKKVMAPKMSKLPLSSTHMSASNYGKEKCFGNASTVGQQMEQETHLIKSFTGLRPIIAEKAVAKPIVSSIKEINHNLSLKEMSSKKISAPLDSVTSFSVALLQQCTNYFGDDYLIRNTNMGKVYMAELYEGKLFTVLKLNKLSSSITVDDFHQLVTHLSELRHQNIIELVGYCSEFGERLLTFKYFSKITLHDLLYGSLKKRLSWNDRIQIALETAKAMEYLHEFCKPPVMLRNLEPSCILLDDELAVRISEYGLSMFVLSNSLTQFSCARAPLGYDAPENGEPGPYTVQSDVYSFGVVMLELLTGRQRYDRSQSLEEHHLVRWASSQLYDMNALSKIVDPYIDGVVSLKPLSRFADIISRCIQQAPEFRPSMSQIVQDISLVLNDAPV